MLFLFKRIIRGAVWVSLSLLTSVPTYAQGAIASDTPALHVNCHIGGKLFIDREFIGVVLKGYQYPIYDVATGKRTIRIVGPNQTWETIIVVTNVKPILIETPEPKVVVKPPKAEPPKVVVKPPKAKPPRVVVTPPKSIVKTRRKTWVVSDLNLRLAPIEAGSFKMGDDKGKPYEKPVHTVILSSPFWMGTTEVTSIQFKALVPKFRTRGRPNDTPMVNVTWWDAVAFCEALTAKEQSRIPEGYQFRLPTEAEWEYCCRAGSTTRFSFGDAADAMKEYGVTARSPQKVGSLKPNAWGIYDMYGNVQELCLDAGDSRLRTAPKTYVQGVADPLEAKGAYRIMRGGHYKTRAAGQYSAIRFVHSPTRGYKANGFRIVLAPKKPLPSEGKKPRGR